MPTLGHSTPTLREATSGAGQATLLVRQATSPRTGAFSTSVPETASAAAALRLAASRAWAIDVDAQLRVSSDGPVSWVHRRFEGTSLLAKRCAWWPAPARGRAFTRACRRDGLDRGRSLRLHGICSRPGRPPAAGRLATCRPRVPLGRAPGPGPARHATPANVRSRLRAHPLSSPSRRPPGGGRGARLGPSRPSTACAPAVRCGPLPCVPAAVPGGPGTGLFDDRGAVFADAKRPRARR